MNDIDIQHEAHIIVWDAEAVETPSSFNISINMSLDSHGRGAQITRQPKQLKLPNPNYKSWVGLGYFFLVFFGLGWVSGLNFEKFGLTKLNPNY